MAMRVAIVHEWVQARAGSEKVFEAMAGVLPNADLFALSAEPETRLHLGARDLRTTILDRPALRNRRELTFPIMPLAWRVGLPRHEYDAVITSHHAFATQNRLARTDGRHLAYVHSPARYLWRPDLDPRGVGLAIRALGPPLRWLDKRSAARLTSVAANSSAVADRVQAAWGLQATVLHPPVDTDFYAPGRDESIELPYPDGFVLGFGRWIEYKNMATVIAVGQALGMPTVVAGSGPLRAALQAQAADSKAPVHLVERPSDAVVRELLRRAGVLVFPTVEDFGIVPVEAQASGTPVVAPRAGGALETIIHERTGVLTDGLAVPELAEAASLALRLDSQHCVANAAAFSRPEFARKFLAWTQLQQEAGAA